MKKFVTTLLALLLTVALAVGFTACKDEENEGYNEVTEEVWKSALSLFSGDPAKINTDDLNLTIESKTEGGDYKNEVTTKYDYANKTYSSQSADDYTEYAWEEGGAIYVYSEYDFDGNAYEYKEKEKFNYTYREFAIEWLFEDTMLGAYIEGRDLLNSYSASAYNADSGCYVYNYTESDEDGDYFQTIKIYFSGDKVVKLENSITGVYDAKESEIYIYGPTTATIPEYAKSYPVTLIH